MSNSTKTLITWDKWKSPIEEYSQEYQEDERGLAYSKLFLRILENEFNLWTINTNFYIDDDILNCMETTEGVETLDVISPYRARIGIGKLFNEEDVQVRIRRNIQKVLNFKTKSKQISYLDAINRLISNEEKGKQD